MARLNVNPTRMELSKLKDRLRTATRGHKLLKDKQDELMRQFIELIRQNKVLREQVEKKLLESFSKFRITAAMMSPQMLEVALTLPKQSISLEVEERNVMSVRIPEMSFKRSQAAGGLYPYGYVSTPAELDEALRELDDVMEELLELAKIEKTCQLMADEIEKTRRRVNALEYRTIPDLEETIKYIRMKLDENERATITRLMKVKELIAKDEQEAY
ncbi:MAG TPA: V-type ATP synthase subunit D [Clostridia bacterium]|nr:V-type ATP synthase subunit D [Clostridia bacterium]